MTQSDSIPPVPIEQDGSGPDKSTATILPYTQKGTPSTLANDGLLGGPLVESDAELIALGWLEPPPTPFLDLLLGQQPGCPDHGVAGCPEWRGCGNSRRNGDVRGTHTA